MAPKTHVALAAVSLLLTSCLVTADCNVSSNQTSVNSPDDVTSISGCSSIDGALSLLLNSDSSAWSSDSASVDLGSIGSIEGALVIYPSSKPKKTVVTAKSLKTIEGELTIWNTDTSNDVQNFQLSFPAIQSITKDYALTGLFGTVSFTHGDGLQVGKMMRVYSTNIETLDFGGLGTVKGDFSVDTNSKMKKLTVGSMTTAEKGFALQTNSALTSVSFPKLKTVKGAMTIYKNTALTYFTLSALEFVDTISFTSNGDKPTVYFPLLSSMGSSSNSSSTFESVGKITFSSLRNVTGAVAFQSTNLEDLTIPLVKTITGNLAVEDNSAMTTFALPRVTSLGDVTIDSNDKLTNVTANALKTASSITMKGSFTNVEFFALTEVTGDFNVQGSSSMDCYWFDNNIKKIVKGKYTCVGNHDEKTRKSSTGGIENTEGNAQDYMISSGDGSDGSSSSGSGSGSSSGSGSGSDSSESSGKKGLSAGAMAGIGVGAAVGAIAIVGAIFFFFWRRKRLANGGPEQRVGSRDSNESRKNPFDGQMLGVHTKIEASAPSPAPSLGTLSFSRNSFLDAGGFAAEKGISALKTIRRVSHSSSGGSETLRG